MIFLPISQQQTKAKERVKDRAKGRDNGKLVEYIIVDQICQDGIQYLDKENDDYFADILFQT